MAPPLAAMVSRMSCGMTLPVIWGRLRPVHVQLGETDAGDLAVLGAHPDLDIAKAAGQRLV